MIDKESQPSYRYDQELHSEGVVIRVVCGLEVHIHQVDSGVGGDDEERFHSGVVDGDEGCEKI